MKREFSLKQVNGQGNKGCYSMEDDENAHDAASVTESTRESSTEIEKKSIDISKLARRTLFGALLIVVMGALTSASFLYLAITNAKNEQEEYFERLAVGLVKEIDATWRDYEAAALWIHESCREWREDGLTREKFRALYEYIISGGLEFAAGEWIPRVEDEDRKEMEAEAYDYFRAHPELNHEYKGFIGQEPDSSDPTSLAMQPRSDQPFYYAVSFVEPQQENLGIFHYDVYSAPWIAATIDRAINMWKPMLTGRFILGQDITSDGYSVVLYHPGVPLSEATGPPEGKARDLSNVVIRLQSLLERGARFQRENLGVYLFDATTTKNTSALPEYLAGVEISADVDGAKTITSVLEITYDELMGSDPYFSYQDEIEVGGRIWSVVVLPVDDSYKAHLIVEIISGSLIFVAAFLLALWLMHNLNRSIQLHRVITKAAAEATIVKSLFPEGVLKRMIADAEMKNKKKQDVLLGRGEGSRDLCNTTFNNYLTSEGLYGSKPIAELHPYCTIMCADLVGFTAWSSVREPSQIFTLLELLFHSFDTIAKKRRVYKVETVGDCYIAVSGLPRRRKDHGVCIARFSQDCLNRALKLVKALETTLGPDTGDLGLRVGIHSGQVTAGVLRGDKGRFQLFGEAVNTTSRMESTGVKNKIQISPATANLLIEAGHQNWLIPREDTVFVDGKGTLRTYFLSIKPKSRASGSSNTEFSDPLPSTLDRHSGSTKSDKLLRLIDWNVEVLSDLLREMVSQRVVTAKQSKQPFVFPTSVSAGTMVLNEVKEVIALPQSQKKAAEMKISADSIKLDQDVVAQLHRLLEKIASMYRDNPFHNFEHASHVTMSVCKMLHRIVEERDIAVEQGEDVDLRSEHEDGLVIKYDPLTRFACIFSALIHDVDHQGVPNMTLVQEGDVLAHKYQEKSVAEQNSVNLAWDILMSPDYEKLRSCICVNQEEYIRFRSLVVNSVMATDIMDKELGAARKERWNKAFAEDVELEDENTENIINRKATIVIEHLIQASDVAHTMQHWHVYINWNEKLFMEMYKAYKNGRLEKDPSIGWYQGEMGFFDFYIIPLAKKLFKCGVFGVSSDEYLNYAVLNRKEWELLGAQMVEKYVATYNEMYEIGSREHEMNYQNEIDC